MRQPVSATSQVFQTDSFKYDPFGRRIYKSSSTATSAYAYDGDNLVEETNATGGVVARYEQTQNIDEPLAMLRSSTTSYYHADGLGSVTSLSNAAGSIANTYTYDSFGKLTASTGSLVNPFLYTARESDTETGLYYYRARYYDPNVGTFLNEDPIGFKGGMDFYSYVHNTAANATDSFGLQKNKCSWSGGCSDMPLPWLTKPCGSGACKNNAVAVQIHNECNAYSNCVAQELGKNIVDGFTDNPLGPLSHIKPPDPNPTHDYTDPIEVPKPDVGLNDLYKMGMAAFLKALQDCLVQHPLAALDPGFNGVNVADTLSSPTRFENFINGLMKILPH
jgi:RHS repeat-associated protein